MTTLSEDFMLLMLDDQTGKATLESTALSYGLAGGVLLDLAMAGRVRVPERGEEHAGRLTPLVGPPLGHPVLDHAMATLSADKPRKPETVIPRLAKNLRAIVLGTLESQGIVRREEGRVLGVFPRTTWPATSQSRENEVRERLWAVLVLGQVPDPRTGALIGLLSATDTARKVFPNEDRRTLRRRAKAIAEGDWASASVRKAISAVQTAVITAVVVAGAGASSAST
jgi:Golgi phosphoprotein 3 (GPP34)